MRLGCIVAMAASGVLCARGADVDCTGIYRVAGEPTDEVDERTGMKTVKARFEKAITDWNTEGAALCKSVERFVEGMGIQAESYRPSPADAIVSQVRSSGKAEQGLYIRGLGVLILDAEKVERFNPRACPVDGARVVTFSDQTIKGLKRGDMLNTYHVPEAMQMKKFCREAPACEELYRASRSGASKAQVTRLQPTSGDPSEVEEFNRFWVASEEMQMYYLYRSKTRNPDQQHIMDRVMRNGDFPSGAGYYCKTWGIAIDRAEMDRALAAQGAFGAIYVMLVVPRDGTYDVMDPQLSSERVELAGMPSARRADIPSLAITERETRSPVGVANYGGDEDIEVIDANDDVIPPNSPTVFRSLSNVQSTRGSSAPPSPVGGSTSHSSSGRPSSAPPALGGATTFVPLPVLDQAFDCNHLYWLDTSYEGAALSFGDPTADQSQKRFYCGWGAYLIPRIGAAMKAARRNPYNRINLPNPNPALVRPDWKLVRSILTAMTGSTVSGVYYAPLGVLIPVESFNAFTTSNQNEYFALSCYLVQPPPPTAPGQSKSYDPTVLHV